MLMRPRRLYMEFMKEYVVHMLMGRNGKTDNEGRVLLDDIGE